ncbi:plasma-membrane proton-efflux P-type ATPase [Candidatus Micrarchaeota archaeon CG1_02_60_51]|nr:MAG: plasma-membrane proton-efflux P-type ATPase [Candidatus Micrarchaeota archaeon CG1_02_60_51]
MDAKQALASLATSEKGLSSAQAAARAKELGFNEIPEKKKSIVLEFLSHFWGPIPWLWEGAILACYFLSDFFDALVLLILVLVNGIVAFYNEHDSQKALELLKGKLTIKTRVLRDGEWLTADARELVPSDIMIVGLGDVVPADAKILSGGISADQAALTGESLPVEAREGDIIFTGSTVKRGEARCAVVNTGMRTYFGKTVELVSIAKPKSKTEEIMFTLSKNVGYAGAALFLVVLAYALYAGTKPSVIVTLAVLFIGGGIPAALPVMFTISQSKGATDLSKKNILVTKLDSIENAASVEVLCLDKTGTLTMNELEVREAIPIGKCGAFELVALAALASSEGSKDSIDAAVIRHAAATKAKLDGCVQTAYKPFEPATKRAEGTVSQGSKRFLAVKGAPQTIASLCKATAAQKAQLDRSVEELSKKGCRALAVARSECGNFEKLTLVGVIGLGDPLRPDSAETIAALREAGVKPIMLTGDNIAVAREIAAQAGIGTRIARISEIRALPEREQADAVLASGGIAEIYPEDKFWVVKLIQSRGKMVGMTGDGVNDAPALKQAELGIAVSTATDVAKAAAGMVLTEPGTKVILEAVKTSREAFQRMLTWTVKKVARSIQFMLILMAGFFWFHDVIVSINGLIFLMIINDFLTMSLAIDNSRASKKPNLWELGSITRASAFVGVLFFLIELAVLAMGVKWFGLDLGGIQTLMTLSLVYTGQLGIYIIRERGRFWQSWPHKYVAATLWFAVVVFSLIALYGAGMAALTGREILATFAVCAAAVLLTDFPKHWVYGKVGIRY